MIPATEMDAIELARQRLPAWVVWFRPVALPLLALALTWLLGRILLWRSLRRAAAEAHWTERAREHWTFRAGLVFVRLLMVSGCVFLAKVFASPLSGVSTSVLCLLALVGVWMGSLSIRASAMRRFLGLRTSFGERVREEATLMILVASSALVAGGAVIFIGKPETFAGAIAMAASLALVLFFGLGGGLFVLRRLGLARPIDEAVVEKAVHDSPVRPTMAVRIDLPMANAIAFPWTGCLAVTERAMSELGEDELVCVLRHEIAHLSEGLGTKLWKLAPLAMLFAIATQRWIADAFGRGAAYATLGSLLVLILVGRRHARRAEERADRHAVADGSAAVYARTLEHLHRVSLAPATTRPWAVHPSLYDRMIEAGVQPDFPRPAAPAQVGLTFAILLATVGGIVYGLVGLDAKFVEHAGRDEPEILRALAIGRIPDYHVADLAYSRIKSGQLDDSILFYRAAAEIAPKNAAYEANLSIALAKDRKCEEAAVVLAEAKHRAEGSKPDSYVQSALSKAEQAVAYCRSLSKPARSAASLPVQAGRKE